MERFWAATTWGVPLALAVTAIWTLHFGEDYQRATFVIGLGFACVIAFSAADRETSTNRLRTTVGLAVMLLVFNHDWIWRGKINDPVAVPLSVIVLTIAFAALVTPIAKKAIRN
jgi:peptidoglycan/LPS O-acetylase OafA/YrhL